MRTHVFRLVLSVAVVLFLTGTAWSQTASALRPGQIKVAKVEQEVTRVLANGTRLALKSGDAVTESDKVVTGKGASVVLVFMNGSSVRLGAETELKIEEFKMDPLAEGAQVNPASLTEEPSRSKTVLNLAHGELVGKVAHLHTDKGSSYSVKTPVGAAGIRGTTFRIVFRPDGTGKAFFTVSTAEGEVVMQGVTETEISIPEGKEVVVQADVTETSSGWAVSNAAVISNAAISAESMAAINASLSIIGQALNTTTFVQEKAQGGTDNSGEANGSPGDGDNTGTSGSGTTGTTDEPQKDSTTGSSSSSQSDSGTSSTGSSTTITPPAATVTTPRLTPGDGT